MARVFLAADGNEWYSAPLSTRDANEWLERAGVKHIKFATSKGKAVLKDAATNRVYLEADRISDLCYFLAFNPVQMQKYRIPFYDWWRPMEAFNSIRPVTHKLYMKGGN